MKEKYLPPVLSTIALEDELILASVQCSNDCPDDTCSYDGEDYCGCDATYN